jgi:predicted O-methyltransferase YrrM
MGAAIVRTIKAMANKRTLSGLFDRVVDLGPRTVIRHLPRRHRELVARKLNQPKHFTWELDKVPSNPQGFEDMSFMFWASPLNRGVIRQDFDEAAALFKAAKECAGGKAVEIGRWNGGSTLMIAVALGENGHLLSIDLMPQDDELLKPMLEKAGVANRIDLVVGDANDYETDEVFDIAFIDGDHSYDGAAKDHNKWGAKVKVGGYIVHHDMSVSRPLCTSRRVLEQLRDDILDVQKNDLELVREAGSMTIFRRTAESWTPIPLRGQSETSGLDKLIANTPVSVKENAKKGAGLALLIGLIGLIALCVRRRDG